MSETRVREFALFRASTARARVRWVTATGEHERVIETRTIVGHAPDVDLVVADPTVSRIHAELDPREDGLWVRDLGSRNGTFVAGVRVAAARIPPDGIVRVGAATLTVSYSPNVQREAPLPDRFGDLVAQSAPMRRLFAHLTRVAASDSAVLIHGETGTGKEVIARAIHDASPRAAGPFVVVDCGSLPENLVESELFGHAKGAFTGAIAARVGALESADGGTVLLDEIGELPLILQPRLLRAIESRTVRRVGETHRRKVNVRFVAATHRDLPKFVNAGAFREDLYFRLSVLPIYLPPLRERREDIPMLARHFFGCEEPPPELLDELARRPWVGNVRELRNFAERARVVGVGRALSMLERDHADRAAVQPPDASAAADAGSLEISFEQELKTFRKQWLELGEREYLRALLVKHGGNVPAAAAAAGLDRAYVYRLVRRYLR